MKWPLPVALIMVLTSCISKPNTTVNSFPFHGDSGVLTKQEVLPFAVAQHIYDSSELDVIAQHMGASEVMAKYYQLKDSAHYLVCMNMPAGPELPFYLLEVMPDGSVRNKQLFHHHHWVNCDQNSPGFGKIKGYFFVRICYNNKLETETRLQFFKTLVPQDSLTSIAETSAISEEGVDGVVISTTGQPTGTKDSITMRYVVTKKTDGKKDLITDIYDVAFVPDGNGFVVKDTVLVVDYKHFF